MLQITQDPHLEIKVANAFGTRNILQQGQSLACVVFQTIRREAHAR
jgi:hypothetical protein